ncbi:MAG: hypothetical protein JWO06_3043 [Bacteroidota bacterium]|nr:hypothetical protein [Bacteroidota bacterium]
MEPPKTTRMQDVKATAKRAGQAIRGIITSKQGWAILLGFLVPFFFAWRINLHTQQVKAQVDKRNKYVQDSTDYIKKQLQLAQAEKIHVLDSIKLAKTKPAISSPAAQSVVAQNTSPAKSFAPFVAVDPGRDKYLSEELKQQRARERLYLEGNLIFFFILAISYFTWFYLRQRQLSAEREKDRDPDELTNLFDTYSEEVKRLGTPRKIKRFSSKVRFQYYVLNLNQKLSKDERELFFTTLLAIEMNRGTILKDTFLEFIPGLMKSNINPAFSNQLVLAANPIVQKVYALNRKIIV